MKRAKVVLSLFAVVAALGASFAFKSAVRSNTTFYTTTVQNATNGAELKKAITTTEGNGTLLWYTTIQGNQAATQAYITTSAF